MFHGLVDAEGEAEEIRKKLFSRVCRIGKKAICLSPYRPPNYLPRTEKSPMAPNSHDHGCQTPPGPNNLLGLVQTYRVGFKKSPPTSSNPAGRESLAMFKRLLLVIQAVVVSSVRRQGAGV